MDRLLREGNPPTGQMASPKPQYKKPGVDEYEPVEGQHGAPFATLKDASGAVVSPATEATLEQVKSELELVKSELEAIKANQLSGDQKVQLSGNLEALTSANTAAIYNATMRNPVTGIKTVTATAAEVFAGASRLGNRRRMIIKNEDLALRCRIGSSSVSQQNGFPLEPGATIEMEFEPTVAVPVYAISEGAPLQLAVIEL